MSAVGPIDRSGRLPAWTDGSHWWPNGEVLRRRLLHQDEPLGNIHVDGERAGINRLGDENESGKRGDNRRSCL